MFAIKIIMTCLALGLLTPVWAQAPGGGGGGGHGGHVGSGGGDDGSCIKAKISHYQPEQMTLVAPGSAFSFFVSGSNGPGHIHVSIRQQPVPVTVEDKATFYAVTGHIPAEYKNETLRISVLAKSKFKKCDAEGGWLLKVGE